jgi:hypothetical protein
MNSRVIAELVFHLGRIASAEGPVEGLTAAQWAVLRYFPGPTASRERHPLSQHSIPQPEGTASQTIKSLITYGHLTHMRAEGDKPCSQVVRKTSRLTLR